MADYVRYRMERMTEELDDLEQRGLFSPAEISEIVRRRGDFEHRLKRPCPIKRDFLDYIDYEKHLDALRKKAIVGKLRKKREEGEDGDGKKNKKGKKGTKWRSGVTGVLRILDIYRLATTRYKGDLGLWFQYLEFCRQRRNGVMKKVAIMALEFGTRDKRQANVHYGNAPMPCVVEENFGEYYFDDLDDLALAEELQNQEGLYQSFQRNVQQGTSRASANTNATLDHVQSVGESSKTFRNATHSQSAQANVEHNSVNRSSQVAWEGGIDPDSMSYEELQQLGEAIGTQSKGLTDEVIELLETGIYRTGLFSKRDKHEECVICCQSFKNRDKWIKLPCLHQYHGHCITKWLRINKVCPVCNKEVFGS